MVCISATHLVVTYLVVVKSPLSSELHVITRDDKRVRTWTRAFLNRLDEWRSKYCLSFMGEVICEIGIVTKLGVRWHLSLVRPNFAVSTPIWLNPRFLGPSRWVQSECTIQNVICVKKEWKSFLSQPQQPKVELQHLNFFNSKNYFPI